MWLVVGAMAGLGAARLARADRIRKVEAPVAPLVSFAPQAMAGGLLGYLLLGRRRVAAAVAGLTGAALASVVLPRAIRRPQPEPDGPVLRVITANLLKGRADEETLVRLVQRSGADVLFLQELTESAVVRLKQAGLADVLPHELIDVRGETSLGSGIYARHPLAEGKSLPPSFAAQPRARLELPGGLGVDVACIHTNPPNPPRPAKVARWREELALLPPAADSPDAPPLVLAGDFNATLDHESFRGVLRRGLVDAAAQLGRGLVPTWAPFPGWPGTLTIDHVLLDPRCAVLAVEVHPLPGSDHRAVYAEFRLPARQAG
ncbi:MAG TPA: endonuclease/exonuclease/phosphatase family protein [Streptosporangiaceae bacterium]|nr:endonuclease/exonuclease/phosphatase family protein [Streptosporangiaceae bacterium]